MNEYTRCGQNGTGPLRVGKLLKLNVFTLSSLSPQNYDYALHEWNKCQINKTIMWVGEQRWWIRGEQTFCNAIFLKVKRKVIMRSSLVLFIPFYLLYSCNYFVFIIILTTCLRWHSDYGLAKMWWMLESDCTQLIMIGQICHDRNNNHHNLPVLITDPNGPTFFSFITVQESPTVIAHHHDALPIMPEIWAKSHFVIQSPEFGRWQTRMIKRCFLVVFGSVYSSTSRHQECCKI